MDGVVKGDWWSSIEEYSLDLSSFLLHFDVCFQRFFCLILGIMTWV